MPREESGSVSVQVEMSNAASRIEVVPLISAVLSSGRSTLAVLPNFLIVLTAGSLELEQRGLCYPRLLRCGCAWMFEACSGLVEWCLGSR